MSQREVEITPLRHVAAITRGAVRRARQALVARAVCGGLGAATLALALSVQCGVPLASPEGLVLATLVGVLAFAAWVRSEPLWAGGVVQRVDDALELRGELRAAHESVLQRPDSKLAQLGAARLLAAIPRRRMLEAAVPQTACFVALPLVSALWLVLAVDGHDSRQASRFDARTQTLALAQGVAGALDRHGEDLTEAQRAAVTAAANELSTAAAGPGADHSQAMRDAAETLDNIARSAPAGSEIAQALADAAARAEAAGVDADAGMDADATEGEPTRGAAEPAAQSVADDTAGQEVGSADFAGPDPAAETEAPAEDSGSGAAVEAVKSAGSTESRLSETGLSEPFPAGPGSSDPGGARGASTEDSGSASGGQEGLGSEHGDSDPGDSQPSVEEDGLSQPEGPSNPGAGALGTLRWWSDGDAALVEAWVSQRGS